MVCRKLPILLFVAGMTVIPARLGAQMQMGSQGTAKDQDAKVQRYKLTGTVKSVDTKGRKVVVDHKDIPGFMAAMTMPYNAGKDENITKLNPGDRITADVVVGSGDTHLENIKGLDSQGQPKDK